VGRARASLPHPSPASPLWEATRQPGRSRVAWTHVRRRAGGSRRSPTGERRTCSAPSRAWKRARGVEPRSSAWKGRRSTVDLRPRGDRSYVLDVSKVQPPLTATQAAFCNAATEEDPSADRRAVTRPHADASAYGVHVANAPTLKDRGVSLQPSPPGQVSIRGPQISTSGCGLGGPRMAPTYFASPYAPEPTWRTTSTSQR
jgi:hypothetical protein